MNSPKKKLDLERLDRAVAVVALVVAILQMILSMT